MTRRFQFSLRRLLRWTACTALILGAVLLVTRLWSYAPFASDSDVGLLLLALAIATVAAAIGAVSAMAMRRLQFSLKMIFIIVGLAGVWSLICRLALLAITDGPVEFRSSLLAATITYLVLTPAAIVFWSQIPRMNIEKRPPITRFVLSSTGMMLFGLPILAALFVVAIMMVVKPIIQQYAPPQLPAHRAPLPPATQG